MSCKHVDALDLCPPKVFQAVHREECTQCFDSIDHPSGLDVCLSCFNGACTGERNHASEHYRLRQHPLVLNIRRKGRETIRKEPPQKISKLAIAAETEADRYQYQRVVRCLECDHTFEGDESELPGKLAALIEAIVKANTFSTQEEVKAWEQEFTSCEHINLLRQEVARQIQSHEMSHCSHCVLHENLWLCLQCGNLGCGRAQFGGLRGNSHGVQHKNQTGHAVAVKLGSITPEGTADVYCYDCDEERIDDNLGSHLAHWGILIADRQKTEKSLMEMQVEENFRWEFSMMDEGGHDLQKLFGEGFTGLKNLGNSCYVASVLQCLFSLPQFKSRYYLPKSQLPTVNDPAQDLETQLRKLADGLLSGRYSRPDIDSPQSGIATKVSYQKGLAPAMLKHLIGRGHVEFSTMRQQDAFEFLLHIFRLITRSEHRAPLHDPTEAFRFVMEQRLQCMTCKKVRYRCDEQDNISIPVPVRRLSPPQGSPTNNSPDVEYEAVTLNECLDAFTSAEIVQLDCVSCGSKDGFSKRSLFKTLPEVLAINARRFSLVNWVPTKIDVPVVMSDDAFSLDTYISPGRQADEEILLDESTESEPAFVADVEAMQQLQSMGFPLNRCERALCATGNIDANTAMEWLFAHIEDPDIDAPLRPDNDEDAVGGADAEKVETLGAMGFAPSQARKALRETQADMERAIEWLFSHPENAGGEERLASLGQDNRALRGSNDLPANFELNSIICHKGASIHAGHYVAFIRKELPGESSQSWVLYNDEKVVKASDVEEMKKFAYVYFFKRA